MVYEVETYELHAQKHRVEAASEAEAIDKVWSGDSELVGDTVYIESPEDYGLPADEYPDVVTDLFDLGENVDDIIPGIRSIQQVD
jgi:hypothetical protein